MIKKICFTLIAILIGFGAYAQEYSKDTTAIQILDKMSSLFFVQK